MPHMYTVIYCHSTNLNPYAYQLEENMMLADCVRHYGLVVTHWPRST